MKIKRNGKEWVNYSTQDLNNMSRDKLRLLKQEIQKNIEEVSWKKSNYNATNEEELNSKEYHKHISNYKKVFAILKSQILTINKILKTKEEDSFKKREHWLWCFYCNTEKVLNERKFNELIKATDESANYHVEVFSNKD